MWKRRTAWKITCRAYRIQERPAPVIKKSRKTRRSQNAFLALHEAVKMAGETILDIVMELDIVVPDEWINEVMVDLCARQAIIKSRVRANGTHIIRTNLRLCNMMGYSSHLAQLSQGTGLLQVRLHRREDQ